MQKHERIQGMSLITVLLMLLLLLAMTVITVGLARANMIQNRDSEQSIRARLQAESGQTALFALLANEGRVTFNTILKGAIDAFSNTTSDAATTPIVPEYAKAGILDKLNAAYSPLK